MTASQPRPPTPPEKANRQHFDVVASKALTGARARAKKYLRAFLRAFAQSSQAGRRSTHHQDSDQSSRTTAR